MNHFAINNSRHIRPARPALFLLHTASRHSPIPFRCKISPDSFFEDATERRLRQEDRLIALGLIVCFLVQGVALLL